MVSVFDQQQFFSTRCFGKCKGSEDFKYDFMTQQNKHQGNLLSAEEQRKKKEIDDMLSEAMNELTFEERQRQQEVLHGVEDAIAEEPNFINNSLQELEIHLMRIKTGSAYEIAESLDPAYVSDTEFRTLFLRCNEYDAGASASQMIQFFEVKQTLFGVQKLVQEITINDLDENDLEALNWIRLIGKDASGRVVYMQFPGLRNYQTIENELRGKFYFQMWLLKSEETKLKGVVEVNYAVGEFFNRSKDGYVENSHLSNSTPLFHSAVHFACDDIQEYFICKLGVKLMPPKLRARLRLHFGSHLECQYRLSTFGISKVLLPTSEGFNYHMHGSQAYLEGRDGDSHGGGTSSVIIHPNINDVLYAGGRANNNTGNLQLRNLVAEFSGAYNSSANEAKKFVIDKIVNKVHESGGRFLNYVDGVQPVWALAPEVEVRTKIAQMFRNQKRAEARRNIIDGNPIKDEPLPDDVIFGKSQRNRGKHLMQQLIKEHYDEYNALDRGRKVLVVNVILDAIKGKGGRFLQPTPGGVGHLEVSDDKARERISKYFRNYRRATKNKAT